ncbi:MAG: hypothetical protein U0163_04155 [Gemmatimonadaceae bacterium]
MTSFKITGKLAALGTRPTGPPSTCSTARFSASGPGERLIDVTTSTNLPTDSIGHYAGTGTPGRKMLPAEHEDDTVAVYPTMVKLNLDTLNGGTATMEALRLRRGP